MHAGALASIRLSSTHRLLLHRFHEHGMRCRGPPSPALIVVMSACVWRAKPCCFQGVNNVVLVPRREPLGSAYQQYLFANGLRPS
jgi:hypothetical protein